MFFYFFWGIVVQISYSSVFPAFAAGPSQESVQLNGGLAGGKLTQRVKRSDKSFQSKLVAIFAFLSRKNILHQADENNIRALPSL